MSPHASTVRLNVALAVLGLGSGCLDLDAAHYGFERPAFTDGGRVDGGPSPCPLGCDKGPTPACLDREHLATYPTGRCTPSGCVYEPTIVQCGDGCVDAGCALDTCAGVVCQRPPAPVCVDATHVRVSSPNGSCTTGSCFYSSTVVACVGTCVDGHCTGDPCTGVTCNAPPPSECVDATHVKLSSLGVCVADAGICSYGSTVVQCSAGCANGACVNDHCLGCLEPPPDTCANPTTRRAYASPGNCVANACIYSSADVPCEGTKVCQSGACVAPPVTCTATSCAGGCCQNDTCVLPANQSDSKCGSGAAVCGACGSGFVCSSGACEDVNECNINNGGCSVNATCTNTAGSRTCQCLDAFTGDGVTCTLTRPPGGCPTGMSLVSALNLCIDSFEASLGERGAARSVSGVAPWVSLTTDQAKAACAAAGKYLCTEAEWQAACSGPSGLTYPYGSLYSGTACNGADKGYNALIATGSLSTCQGAAAGLYDMSGNAYERTSTCSNGSCRVRGGSFRSSASAGLLKCTQGFDFPEAGPDNAVAFRCCLK